jgi:hypothetical protein
VAVAVLEMVLATLVVLVALVAVVQETLVLAMELQEILIKAVAVVVQVKAA